MEEATVGRLTRTIHPNPRQPELTLERCLTAGPLDTV